MVGRLSLHMSQVAHQAGAYPGLCTMRQLGVFLLPLDGMLVIPRVIISIIHSINFADTPKYTLICGEMDPESKVACPRKQCNVPSLACIAWWFLSHLRALGKRERRDFLPNSSPFLLPPPYFSLLFWLTPGVLLPSPAFRLLVQSPRRLKKERNWLLRRLAPKPRGAWERDNGETACKDAWHFVSPVCRRTGHCH